MTVSGQLVGTLIVVAIIFALILVPMGSTTRLLTAALVLTIGGGAMAFLRARSVTRH